MKLGARPSVVCWGGTRVGMARQGYDLQLTRYDEKLARDLLHDRDGALADERDRHRVGAHAVARDTAGGMGGVDTSRYLGGNLGAAINTQSGNFCFGPNKDTFS